MWQKIKNIYHLIQAVLANVYYGFPSRKIKVIGITGTDGKTTTTNLIAHILKESGKKVSFISTVYAEVAGKIYDVGLHVTTPSSFMIQKFLRQAVLNGDEYFVLETTSHALDQNRVWGVKYEIGLITNITHEHLDYHKSFENYVKAKEKLLKMAKIGIINKNIKYQIANSKYTYQILNIIKKEFHNLPKFNQENYSAAFMICKILGLNDYQIIKAMKSFKLPKGRLEVFYDKDFKVIIDFAHTPNAFLQLLPEIRKKFVKKNGRLIHIFGSAGLRDKTKRPKMGEISSLYSDYIILTEEDYRTENLKDICKQIASGIKNKPYEIIENREKAIEKAIFLTKKNYVILLTGKSHEKSLARGKKEYPWSEHQAVEKAIKKVQIV
ncbi:MAG: UDP-N-acetylmuramoyl-L-alanyl-D-glutamate--2,6-diaminopimelate ligase [Candidatus Microgenomates bacterium]